MKNHIEKTDEKFDNIHSIFVSRKGVSKIGISGLKNLIIVEKIISNILKENIQKKYNIEKIIQINFLNKNIGRLFTIFVFKNLNQDLMNLFFNNFGIHFFTTKNDFTKNLDSRDFIFLKEKTIYKNKRKIS